MFLSEGSAHPRKSPRPSCSLHRTIVGISPARNYLWVPASPNCRPPPRQTTTIRSDRWKRQRSWARECENGPKNRIDGPPNASEENCMSEVNLCQCHMGLPPRSINHKPVTHAPIRHMHISPADLTCGHH